MHVVDNHSLVLDNVTGKVWEKYLPDSTGTNSDGFFDGKVGSLR